MIKDSNKKIALVEHGLHKIYQSTYKLFDENFDIIEIITDDNKHKIKSINIKVLKSIKIFAKSWVYYNGLYNYLKRKNFDIVNVRPYYRPYSFIALIFCILHKKKFTIAEEQRNDPHNLIENVFFHLWLLLIRPLINLKVHKIICVTKQCYDYMKKKKFKRLIYIPIPYEPKKWPKKINNAQKKLKIICIARFEWLKAHHVLIKAIAYLIKNREVKKEEIEVNLLGKGCLMENMKELCKKLDVDDIINFVGFVPNEKIDAFCQNHNLFVLSSISEPIGMVVFEAMSNGLPIIVSSNTGAKGSVYEGINGYIFKAGDYKDLAEKILLMKNPKTRQKFGEESIRILKRENNPFLIRKRYKKIFQ